MQDLEHSVATIARVDLDRLIVNVAIIAHCSQCSYCSQFSYYSALLHQQTPNWLLADSVALGLNKRMNAQKVYSYV